MYPSRNILYEMLLRCNFGVVGRRNVLECPFGSTRTGICYATRDRKTRLFRERERISVRFDAKPRFCFRVVSTHLPVLLQCSSMCLFRKRERERARLFRVHTPTQPLPNCSLGKMNYISSSRMILLAWMFLPTPVDGFFFFFIYDKIRFYMYRRYFTEERNERDCQAVRQATGLNRTEYINQCSCFANNINGVFITCYPREIICMSPFDGTYCAPSAYGGPYQASSTTRELRASTIIPSLKNEAMVINFEVPGPRYLGNRFTFKFERGIRTNTSSSKKYVRCSVTSEIYSYLVLDRQTSDYQFDQCTSCDICDNGVDFKYDCSNANGTGLFVFGNMTNTTILVPGPKVESCIPVASIIPSY